MNRDVRSEADTAHSKCDCRTTCIRPFEAFPKLDGENVASLPLLERKELLAQLLKDPPAGVVYSEHEGGDGQAFRGAACGHGLEGVASKRTDRAPRRRSGGNNEGSECCCGRACGLFRGRSRHYCGGRRRLDGAPPHHDYRIHHRIPAVRKQAQKERAHHRIPAVRDASGAGGSVTK
jgi:hypothetical protein